MIFRTLISKPTLTILILAAMALNSFGNEPSPASATTTADSANDTTATESTPSTSESSFRFRSKASVRDERKGHFYVAAFGGISYGGNTEDPEINITNPVGGLAGTQEINPFDEDNNGAVAGLKIGYETSGYQPSGIDFLVIRPALEVELMYAPQSLAGATNFLTAAAGNAGAATYSQDVEVFTVMLNPIARFQLFDRYTPYIGGGFGAALLDADAPTTTFAGANALGSGSDEEISLSLQAIAGFEVDIMHGFSIFTEYKFHYMRDLSFSYANTTLGTNAKFDYTDLT
ncbi:MAG: hypothetical protein AAF571_12560, partial [Verrucomicrobiota bacterium]